MIKLVQHSLNKFFHFGMALLVTAIVMIGFGQTINANLPHPAVPRPAILSVHAAIFCSWVALFVTQTALARTSNVRWHRRLGWGGVALGSLLPVFGIATALVMQKWHRAQGPVNDAFLAVSFNDMLTFAIAFGLAV